MDSWSPPEYDLSKSPRTRTTYSLKSFPQNFARSAKWSPDGSVFLAQCENRTFQIFHPPLPSHPTTTTTTTTKLFPQPAPILDFLWYPSATPYNPASFCFLASVRECPVKLLDASDGRLRASYRIVDHRERQVAPHSLAFNLSAQKLYCGYEDAIEVFHLSVPGSGTRLPTTPSRKSKDGLKGIISSLAFAPSHTSSDLYAAGSLSPAPSNIALFSEDHGPAPLMFISGGPRAGVTQIQFNPARPHMMYASFRRHAEIYSWDLRGSVEVPVRMYQPTDDDGPSLNTGQVSGKGVGEIRERTNQKLRFDVDSGGTRLGVGDHLGNVSLFNLDEAELEELPTGSEWSEDTLEVKPSLKFPAHADAIGSVSFNPVAPVLLTVSGSRHFDGIDESDSEDGLDGDGSEDAGDVPARLERSDPARITRQKDRPQPVTLDSSIKLWSF